MRTAAVTVMLLISLVSAQAAMSPIKFRVETDRAGAMTEKKSKGSYGKGKDRTDAMTFKVDFRNVTMNPAKFDYKVYVIATNNIFKARQTQLYISYWMENKDIEIPPSAIKTADLGVLEFESWESKNTSYKYRGGVQYKGYVVQVFVDGELVEEEYKGGSKRVLKQLVKDFKPPKQKSKKKKKKDDKK